MWKCSIWTSGRQNEPPRISLKTPPRLWYFLSLSQICWRKRRSWKNTKNDGFILEKTMNQLLGSRFQVSPPNKSWCCYISMGLRPWEPLHSKKGQVTRETCAVHPGTGEGSMSQWWSKTPHFWLPVFGATQVGMFARAAVVTTPMELLVSGERKPTKKNRGLGIDDFQWANGGFGIDQELALKQCADRMFMHRVW